MTITSQTTRQGKVIHLLSPGDLVDVVESGQRLRAYCPIHGGDHQRSLSIDSSTGWGFCHCCHATVLVETSGTLIPDRGESRDERCRAENNTRSPPSYIAPLPTSSFRPDPVRSGRTAIPLPRWQQDEVAALIAVTPLMSEALTSSRRAQAYLNERDIPPAIAHAARIGYVSRSVWERAPVPAEQQPLLQRWIGRVRRIGTS